MDTDSLTAFIEVADHGSFSVAAERLHLSQPAVSKRIANLEDRLGRRLFDRVARRVVLTDAGRTLLPHARKVLADLEDAKRALSRLSADVSGRLSVGTSHHIGLHRLPRVLKHYAAHYPDVDLDLHFMDSEVACEAVVQGRLELGIVTLPLEPIDVLEARQIWHDPLDVVLARGHPLAGVSPLSLAQLAEHPTVLPDEATYTHRIITAEFQRQGVTPRVRLATNYLETLKMLVAIGLGWSVLPRSMLDSSILAVEVEGLHLSRELGVVSHRRRLLSRAAEALISTLVDESRTILAS